mgnify:CR=1 FL=1
MAATRRIAFWATLAKTALRISWKTAAPILVAPSEHGLEEDACWWITEGLTGEDGGASDGDSSAANSSKVYVHGIYDGFEIEGDLDVQNLGCH